MTGTRKLVPVLLLGKGHMKFKKTINAPQQYIFDKVIESVLFDIERSINRKLNAKVLQGFEYQKVISGRDASTIKIDEVTIPSVYAFSTETPTGYYTTRWEFKNVSEAQTEIFINESMKAKSLMQVTNNFIMRAFMQQAKKRSMQAMLDKMVESYKKGGA